MNYLIKLDRARLKILGYLFDNNARLINDFKNNKPIKVNDKWNFLLNNTIGNKSNIYYNDLLNYINEQVKNNNSNQLIHPALIIICYPDLENTFNFTGFELNNNYWISINNDKSVCVTYETNILFQLYVDILTNTSIDIFQNTNKTNDLANEIINSVLFGLEVSSLSPQIAKIKFTVRDDIYKNNVCEKLQEKNFGKKTFISKMLNQFTDTILINTNTKTNNYTKKNIFTLTFNSGILFDDTFSIDKVCKIFYTEISRYIFSNYDNNLGCIFYLNTQLNLCSPILNFVSKVHESTITRSEGFELVELIKEMEKHDFIMSEDFIEKIKSDLCYDISDINDLFVFYNPIKILNSRLKLSGVLAIFNIPKNQDFKSMNFMKFLMEFNVYHSNFLDTSLYLSKDNGEGDLLKNFVSNIPLDMFTHN